MSKKSKKKQKQIPKKVIILNHLFGLLRQYAMDYTVARQAGDYFSMMMANKLHKDVELEILRMTKDDNYEI